MSTGAQTQGTAPAARLSAALLLIAVVLAVALNGAVLLEVQAGVLALLALASGALALAPSRSLAGRGRAVRTVLPFVAVIGIGLLAAAAPPQPALSPSGGVPAPPWALEWVLRQLPARIEGALPYLIAGAGTLTLGVLLSPRRRRLERAASVALLALAAITLVHRLALPAAMYGVLPVQAANYQGWAPLVNANFNATLALGLLPLAARAALMRPDLRSPWTWAGGVATVAGVALIAATGSLGAAIGLGAALVMLAVHGALGQPRFVPIAVTAASVAVLAPVAAAVESWSLASTSLGQRLDQWGYSLHLLADRAVVGVGPGQYVTAYPPYQDPYRFALFDHVHSDPLEWLIELGVIGGVAVVAVAWFAWRAAPRPLRSRAPWLTAGLVAVFVHSLVDFPLHLPGLLLLFCLGIALRIHGFQKPAGGSGRGVRAALIAVAALCLGGAALAAGLGWVDRAARDVLTDADPARAADLARLAPWRAEPLLVELRAAHDDAAQRDRVVDLAARARELHPYDARIALHAGLALVAHDHLDLGTEALEQAARLHRADHRPHAVLSRIAQARGDREATLDHWVNAVQRWPFDAAKAQRPFERALQLQPVGLWWVQQLEGGPTPSLAVLLGRELLRADDPDAALVAFDLAAQGKPSYRTLPDRGRAMIATGQLDRGLDLLARGVDEHGPQVLEIRAAALRDHGRLDEAVDEARAAITAQPDRPEAALLLLEIERERGGVPALLDAAERLPIGLARRHPKVASPVAQAAAEGRRWSICVDWLTAATSRTASDDLLLQRCRAQCPLCR